MFFAPKFSYVIEYFILLFHHKQILVSVNISSLGLVAPVPAGSSVPQLTRSLEGRGRGQRIILREQRGEIILEDC